MNKDPFLSQIYKKNKVKLSYEVFPPKTENGADKLIEHLSLLKVYSPDFISVTYGAGGGTQEKSLGLLKKIKEAINVPLLSHYTCVGADEQNVLSFVSELDSLGISNILALRGDPPSNDPNFDFSRGCFQYANELVTFLNRKTDFCVAVAGYPEGHIQAPSKEADWDTLKKKVDAGASCVITQLFFDNSDFWKFKSECEKRNINVPIVPGILPVSSADRLDRIISLSGSKLNHEFKEIERSFGHQADDFYKASLDYSKKQISELIAGGIEGLHLYILNQSKMISDILKDLNYKFSVKS